MGSVEATKTTRVVSEPRPPSLRWRAVQAIAVLAAFYVVTILFSAILFGAPISMFFVKNPAELDARMVLLAFVCGWVPAGLLIKGALGVKRPRFEPPSKPVQRAEAPELFEILDALAVSAATSPPAEVYLSPGPEVGVSEVGGTFGFGARRILLLGVPMAECLTVPELRAVLAHELGHYVGGDTRLCGVLSYTEASFHSVLTSMHVKPNGSSMHALLDAGLTVAAGLGRLHVGLFVRLYLRLTRPSSRRQEVAADFLAARLAGRDVAIRALEKTSIFAPLYSAYLGSDVKAAIANDVVPSDLLAGFRVFRTRIHERGKEASLAELVRAEKTDPFDSHPALTERVATLREAPEGPVVVDDERSALDLFADRRKLDEWLARATGDAISGGRVEIGAVKLLRWSKIMRTVLPKSIRDAADDLELALRPLHPAARSPSAMFVAVVRSIAAGGIAKLAVQLEPQLLRVPPNTQVAAGKVFVASALRRLFQGALLERGATIDASLAKRATSSPRPARRFP